LPHLNYLNSLPFHCLFKKKGPPCAAGTTRLSVKNEEELTAAPLSKNEKLYFILHLYNKISCHKTVAFLNFIN
jgi:hypothetical protein